MSTTIDQTRLAYHEAAHAVVARLFSEDLYMPFMTILPSKEKGEETMFGSVNIKSKGNPGFSMGLVSLAGMVGEHIKEKGKSDVLANKADILNSPEDCINSTLGGGDLKIFEKDSSVNSWKYASAAKEYQQLCLGTVIDYLCNHQIWPVVEQLAQKVIKKPDLTLQQEELEDIFKNSKIDEWISKNKENILKKFKRKTTQDMQQDEINNLLDEREKSLF